jgi:hypothetical protein
VGALNGVLRAGRVGVAVMGPLFACFGWVGVAPASAAQPSVVALVNVVSGKCADLPWYGPGRVDGPVSQYDCRPGAADNQTWKLLPNGHSHGFPRYLVQNVKDGLCLDVPFFGRVAAGTPVTEYHCREQDNQLYYTKPNGHGAYYFVNDASGLCLDVAGVRSTANDARLTLWPCSADDDHVWRLRQPSAGQGRHPGATPAGARVQVNGGLLRVRKEPSTSSTVTHRLADNTLVNLSCKVSSQGRTWLKMASGWGYLAGEFVTGVGSLGLCPPAKPARPERPWSAGPESPSAGGPDAPRSPEPKGLPRPGANGAMAPGIYARGAWTEETGACRRNTANYVDEGEMGVDPEKHAEPWVVYQTGPEYHEPIVEGTWEKQVAVSRVKVESYCSDAVPYGVTLAPGQYTEHVGYRRYIPVEHVFRTRGKVMYHESGAAAGFPIFPSEWHSGTGPENGSE